MGWSVCMGKDEWKEAGEGLQMKCQGVTGNEVTPLCAARLREPHPEAEDSISSEPPPNQRGVQRNFPTVRITFITPRQEQYCIVMSPGF